MTWELSNQTMDLLKSNITSEVIDTIARFTKSDFDLRIECSDIDKISPYFSKNSNFEVEKVNNQVESSKQNSVRHPKSHDDFNKNRNYMVKEKGQGLIPVTSSMYQLQPPTKLHTNKQYDIQADISTVSRGSLDFKNPQYLKIPTNKSESRISFNSEMYGMVAPKITAPPPVRSLDFKAHRRSISAYSYDKVRF
ncbi:hypothetical protein AYI69_g5472 [Smittium culicis]|uniref:Uncharacterized protein n=1 Tax=Smittium culicis TaxID=133412 RepID=A0A1R1Y5E7_9FUNG|nr:hypothetical protein AYI69_g5472 [Smittium culicis]